MPGVSASTSRSKQLGSEYARLRKLRQVAAIAALIAGGTEAAQAESYDSVQYYSGIFAGSGSSMNSLVDIEGFANTGNPGSVTEYDGSGTVGGLLIGSRIDQGGLALRVEMDMGMGNMSAETDLLDPEGRDESAVAQYHWISSMKLGAEYPVGSGSLFATAGIAFAEISNSATDIDGEIYIDPDDSFSDTSVATGGVIGIGAEYRLSDDWTARVEGLYYDFGSNTFEVNRSANNKCADAGNVPCPYEVSNQLQAINFALIRYF